MRTDHNPLLRLTLHVDHRADVYIALRTRCHLLDINGDGMRNLIARQREYFLAYKFGNDQPFRLICHHIRRIVLRSLGQMCFDLREKPLKIFSLTRRNWHNTRKVIRLRVVCEDGQYLFACDAVHLVHGEQNRHADTLKLF